MQAEPPSRRRAARCAALAFVAALAAACGGRAGGPELVRANDNRAGAGRLSGGVLTVRLDVVRAEWRPEADSGPGIVVAAFAEAGRAPKVPGPLLRVPSGTTIAATVRNGLTDSTITVFGLFTRPAAGSGARDSLVIPPGQSREVRFAAGAPGTYLYWAREGVQSELVEREQLAGAFVVDSAGARGDDRVFVMNIWSEPVDSVTWRNALAINGRAYPFTERIEATVGDTLRWRWINATRRAHPMHLHGFYYAVTARGDGHADTVYAAEARRMVVTEDMREGQTMDLAWVPDRDGNWLFHCHIAFHVVPDARLTPPEPGDPARAHEAMSHEAGRHMAGLVLGIAVRAPRGWHAADRGPTRELRLYVQEGRPRGRAHRALGFVLQRDARVPAGDSVEIPGSLLVLARGEPTDITVVNRLAEPTAVHWHGIELESWSDGVAGWSGSPARLAPGIAPGDSFIARLTLPRAGTFIYHTHINDLVQLTSGLYGAIVVLEPGRRFDPATDHVVVAGWDGGDDPPAILVNGDSLPGPLELASGAVHRFRFVNIGSAVKLRFALERAGAGPPATWRLVAKDGADLPAAQLRDGAALVRLQVGETADVEFRPPGRGEYRLVVDHPELPRRVVRRVVVR